MRTLKNTILTYLFSKHTALLATFMVICFTANSQAPDFVGIITYKSDYRLNMDDAKINQMKQAFGDTLRIYYDGNNYKQHYRNSGWLQEVTYLGEKNKYYMVFSKFDTIYTADCSRPDDNYVAIVDFNDQRQICGHVCYKLIMQGENVKKTYFFTPDLPLRQADYSRHKMGGYDQYMKNAQAAYLYLRVETQSGIQEYTAVKIEPKQLPGKVFELLPIPVK